MKCRKFLLALAVALVSICPVMAGKLFKAGKSRYAIVVAKDASQSELTAAEELQEYIYKISGAKLTLISEDKAAEHKRYIFVGYNPEFGEKLGIERPADYDEAFNYRSVGNNLWIYGGKQRGTMYGVYAFLENELEVRWYTPKCTYIPELKSYILKKLNHTEKPYIGIRFTDYKEAQVDDFLAHNKLNSRWGVVHNKYGGLNGYWGAHTFGYFVPDGKYFAEHPEYFSMRDGERKPYQLCLTNPEVLELCKQGMKKVIAENPDYWVYSLSQNDNQLFCQCEKCQAKAAEYGGQSGLLLWFVNQVADYIKDYYPEKYISTFAYQYTRGVPKNIEPAENVVIRLCSIECCFGHPLAECEHNKPFMDDLKAWSKVAKRLYIWDYVCNFRQYLAPYPNFRVLAPNVKTFKEHNVIGLYEEGVYNTVGGAFADLKAWIIAKLLWNPEQDTYALVRDFIANYYGAAAPYVQHYFDLCESLVKPDIYMNIYFSDRHPIYTDEFIAEATELVNKAREAVENESDEMKHRVDLVRLQMQYLHLMRQPKEALEDGTCDYFFDFIRRHGIRPAEWYSEDDWIKIYKIFYLGEKQGIELPPHLLYLLDYVAKEFEF